MLLGAWYKRFVGYAKSAQFQHQKANAPFGQPFFSLELGHMVFTNVVGPVPMGRGGARYIHYLVNSVTRLGDVMKWRNVSATSIIKALAAVDLVKQTF